MMGKVNPDAIIGDMCRQNAKLREELAELHRTYQQLAIEFVKLAALWAKPPLPVSARLSPDLRSMPLGE